MSQIAIDRSKLLGFDNAWNLAAKVGGKPSGLALDHGKLVGFDSPQNLQAKTGKKPVSPQK